MTDPFNNITAAPRHVFGSFLQKSKLYKDWQAERVNLDVDAQMWLLARNLFNLKCPEHLRKFTKKRVVIKHLIKRIKLLVTALVLYEGQDDHNIYLALRDYDIYALLGVASMASSWETYEYEEVADVYEMLIDISGVSRVGVLNQHNDFVGW